MNFPRPFPRFLHGIELANEVTTYLMVLTGYGALFATGEMGSIHTAILVAGILISFFWDESARPMGRNFWNGLILGFLGFGLVEWFFLEGGFVKAVVHFLGYVQMVRLLSRTGDRDTLWLHLLSFLQLTAAAILTLSMSFLVFFFIYILVGTWALIIFTIKREAQRAQAEVGPEVARPRFYGASGAVAASIFVVSMGVFFVIPRIGAGFFAWANLGSNRVTGFKETVNIGDVGRIKEDKTTVMRVSIRGETGPRQSLYWRGNALDTFDGHSWTTAFAGSRRIFADEEEFFQVKRAYRGERIEQEIYLEPIDSTILFAASYPAAFSLKQPGSMRVDRIGRMGSIVQHGSDFWSLPITGPIQDRVRYWARSDLYDPPPNVLRAASDRVPPLIRANYLALPNTDKRISELAHKITDGLQTNYDKAAAVKDYLLKNYTYTLVQPDKAPEDPLADFLFKRRAGHCEHYATAMAVLLRIVGIPTRMINGFQRGEWNGADNYYRVRQSDAHSWVEVYFDGVGWVLFDPTPSASITYEQNPGLFARIDMLLDTWRYRWNRYIVDYTFDDQARATMRVRDRGAQVGAKFYLQISELVQAVKKNVPGLALVVAIALAALAGAVYLLWIGISRRNRAAKRKERVERSEARQIYLRTMATLTKRGLGRPSALTPHEHAAWVVHRKGSDYKPLEEMADLFGQARFSGTPPPPSEIEKMRNIYKTIKELR